MVDVKQQRYNMVESQVRPNDVTDRRIIRAMQDVPREAFVTPELRSTAYKDTQLVLTQGGPGQPPRALLDARTFSKLVQLADLGSNDVILDIGCASGYSSAVLAQIAETVVALESDASLAERATKALSAQSADNVAVVSGPLPDGYPSEGPYDAIIVEGAVARIADGLLDQLKDGGRLVAVLKNDAMGHATVWQRLGASFDRRRHFEAEANILPGFEREETFVF